LLEPDLATGLFVGSGTAGALATSNFSAAGALDFALLALAGLADDFTTPFVVMIFFLGISSFA
jgi:hypothetical protein